MEPKDISQIEWRQKASTGKIHAFDKGKPPEKSICGKGLGAITYPIEIYSQSPLCKTCKKIVFGETEDAKSGEVGEE